MANKKVKQILNFTFLNWQHKEHKIILDFKILISYWWLFKSIWILDIFPQTLVKDKIFKLDCLLFEGGFATIRTRNWGWIWTPLNPTVPPALQAKMKTRQSGVSVVGGWSTNILPVDSHWSRLPIFHYQYLVAGLYLGVACLGVACLGVTWLSIACLGVTCLGKTCLGVT